MKNDKQNILQYLPKMTQSERSFLYEAMSHQKNQPSWFTMGLYPRKRAVRALRMKAFNHPLSDGVWEKAEKIGKIMNVDLWDDSYP